MFWGALQHKWSINVNDSRQSTTLSRQSGANSGSVSLIAPLALNPEKMVG